MSGQSSNTPPNHSDMTVVIIIVAVVVAALLLWWKANYLVVVPMFALDYTEYWILEKIRLIGNSLDNFEYVHAVLFAPQTCNPACPPSSVDWANFNEVLRDIGDRMRIAHVALIATMSLFILFKMKGGGFRRRFTLAGGEFKTTFRFLGVKIDNKKLISIITFLTKITFTTKILTSEGKEWTKSGASFMGYQAQYWKSTLISSKFNRFLNSPGEEQALTPIEWVEKYNVPMTAENGLDETFAADILQRQLGQVWQGIEQAPYQVQAIALLSALNFVKSKNKDRCLNRLTEIHVEENDPLVQKRLSLELVNSFFKKEKKIVAWINKLGNNHYYVNTAAVRIYGKGGPMEEWGGGLSGIMATSEIRWLKKVDRHLWYALNNVGRRKFHLEGAGVVSHYLAEVIVKEPVPEPYMASVVEGIVEYFEHRRIESMESIKKEEDVLDGVKI